MWMDETVPVMEYSAADMTDGFSTSSRDITRSGTAVQPSPPASPHSTRRSDMEAPLLQEGKAPAEPTEDQKGTARYALLLKSSLYGIINAIVVAPVMIGFAAIIFRHRAFHEDPAVYAALVQLVLFSSAVHQASFSAFSSLPFAIGQVQDAGLIFLSKMAGDIATSMADAPREAMLATVLVSLSGSTALLGLALAITGKLKLAALVQYLPLPVVGGYLAFIGLYCFEAGLALMTGEKVDSLLGLNAPEQWAALLRPEALMALLPGVLGGCAIMTVSLLA